MSDARLPWFRCFPSALLGALAGLSPDEGLVYVTALLRLYETGGPVLETARTLARRTGLAERKVSAALEVLFEAGKLMLRDDGRLDSASTHAEIEWQRERNEEQSRAGRASAAKRQQQTSAEKDAASAKKPSTAKTEKDQQNQQRPPTRVERGRNHLDQDQEIQEEDKLPPDASVREAWPRGSFEVFWEAYPHKVGKDAARPAFDRVRRSGRTSLAELLAGIERYRAAKPPDRSWANPSTWLNQGRWQDEPSADTPLLERVNGHHHPGPGPGRQSGGDAVVAGVVRWSRRSGVGLGAGHREGRTPSADHPDFPGSDRGDADEYHRARRYA